MEQPVREVLFFGTHFGEFYQKQPERARRKIDQVLFLVAHSLLVPDKFLKQIAGTKGLYEIRVEYNRNAYRIFCYFKSGKRLILLNTFQKKSAKTPSNILDTAIRLMKASQQLN